MWLFRIWSGIVYPGEQQTVLYMGWLMMCQHKEELDFFNLTTKCWVTPMSQMLQSTQWVLPLDIRDSKALTGEGRTLIIDRYRGILSRPLLLMNSNYSHQIVDDWKQYQSIVYLLGKQWQECIYSMITWPLVTRNILCSLDPVLGGVTVHCAVFNSLYVFVLSKWKMYIWECCFLQYTGYISVCPCVVTVVTVEQNNFWWGNQFLLC